MRKGKGSGFERQLCRELSLWWTAGQRDDVFWRSSNSGGRAKVRSRKGKMTYGQYGDVCAVDPIGDALTSVCTIEAKRGYPRSSFADVIDKGTHGDGTLPAKQQMFERFLEQAMIDSRNAGTVGWLLICRRDRRSAVVFMPWSIARLLPRSNRSRWCPRVRMSFETRLTQTKRVCRMLVLGTTLQEFFAWVSPSVFRKIAREKIKKGKGRIPAR